MLFCNPRRMRPDDRAAAGLDTLKKSIGDAGDRAVTKMDYLEAALLLCPPIFADRELCETYRGGALLSYRASDGSAADVLLFDFLDGQNAGFAARLKDYAFLCRRDERRAWFDLPGGGFWIGNYPEQGRSLYGLTRGDEILFVSVESGAAGALLARKCYSLFRQEDQP